MLSTLRAGRAVARRAPCLVRGVPSGFRPAPFALQSRLFSSETETLEFKAETKKLLNIVANSLYTDKEIFIRELISNASDALEKLRFMQATHQLAEMVQSDVPLNIRLSVDEGKRLFIIEDTGVGMTRDELVANLGTIAKSGSLDFVEGAKDQESGIIGQFGVGFYSVFVVGDKVEVFTKTCDPAKGDQGFKWESQGEGSYTVDEVDASSLTRGTKIVVHLKDDATQFSSLATVKDIAKKFSAFVNFPIITAEDGKDVEITKQEALWLKTGATEEEHTTFYQYLNNTTYGDPFYTLTYRTDAPLSIKAVFYVPEDAPSRWFQREPEAGVALYSRRVMVKKHADKVVPRWLYWVKGIVDCEDMPMNVSRENMQDSRLMEKLSSAVVRRFLRFLDDEGRKDPEKYVKFYKNYAYYLKAGLLEDQQLTNGRHKDAIMKLLRFECSQEDKGKLVSLEEYADSINPEQKNLYYAYSSTRETALGSPFMENMNARKRNVLILTDEIDEFVMGALGDWKGKKFVSADATDADFEWGLDEPAESAEKESTGTEPALSESKQAAIEAFLKQELGDRVSAVKFTTRLTDSPAIVTSQLSPHLRKMMKNMTQGSSEATNLPVTMELNAKHHLVRTLTSIRNANPQVARLCAWQLYDNACVAAGMVEEPKTLLTRLQKMLEVCAYQGAGYDYRTNEYTNPVPEEAEVVEEAKPEAKFEEAMAEAAGGKPEEAQRQWVAGADGKPEEAKFEETSADGKPEAKKESKATAAPA